MQQTLFQLVELRANIVIVNGRGILMGVSNDYRYGDPFLFVIAHSTAAATHHGRLPDCK